MFCALFAFCAVAGEEVALGKLSSADFEWGGGVDVGDEDLFVLFDGFNCFDIEFFAFKADCCVVVAAMIDESCVGMEI